MVPAHFALATARRSGGRRESQVSPKQALPATPARRKRSLGQWIAVVTTGAPCPSPAASDNGVEETSTSRTGPTATARGDLYRPPRRPRRRVPAAGAGMVGLLKKEVRM